jgi:predicted N-acetyltransferase YhbS
MIETKRLKIYPASKVEMEEFIASQTDEVLRAAYTEMLEGSLNHPTQWEWYAIWMIELNDGTHIGELCFKGLNENGVAEIGYGIGEKYQGQEYATEAVKAVTTWALKQPNVTAIEAETEFENKASLRVLEKSGFVATGKNGQEGARFILHKTITFRLEEPKDYRFVENMVRESFWNVYRPGCLEHFVLHELRDNSDFVKELDYVMEKDGKIIGQNIFMRAHIKADDGRNIPVLAMGPICITHGLKRQGYGKMLLDYTLEKAEEMGFGAMCFEGNIDFYGKSGFTYASKFGIRYHDLPKDADASFFLCKELIPGYLDGITGEYAPPAGYFVDEAKAEEFDKQFPPKRKEKLPGQIFG